MTVSYEVGSISYSARRGTPPTDINPAPASVETNSPVWPLAAAVFVTGYLQNDFLFAVACVLAQLAVMTAVQWLVLFAQRNANILGLKPFRTLPALKIVRVGVFVGAMTGAVMFG